MNKDLDTIHSELLGRVPDIYQKSEGFPVWDILRGCAYGLKLLWQKVFDVEAQMDVDNLTGAALERFVFQRKAVRRKKATKSVGIIRVKAGGGVIHIGDIFSTVGGVQFQAVEERIVTKDDTFPVEAMIPGANGNVPVNTIIQMPVTIPGIVEVTNPEVTKDGYDSETDNALRARYYEILQLPVTSGNIYHYRRWAKEVPGVQEVKVFPLWKGDNTVQVVVIDTDGRPANEELINRVQEYIDPGKAGTGAGQAPVGAHCTVSPAEVLVVNVDIRLIVTEDLEEVKARISENLKGFLRSIAFGENYISMGKINNVILNTKGVSDCDELKLNGSNKRLEIPEKAVALLGVVTVHEL